MSPRSGSGPGAGPPDTDTSDGQVVHQRRDHQCVTALPGTDDHDHRAPVTVDEMVDLGRQTAS
ncbi:MAG TPA: hypothetical protein VGO18_36480 [Steroidobacteraceae bacterium]|nr:hypothetical protein [Steroidobacteraceae bacterium]